MDMLARIANNLFWMGRYLERAEHSARYVGAQYYAALDAPTENELSRALKSILSLGHSSDYEEENELTEESVLHHVCLSKGNPNSIRQSVFYARENARGAIDALSTELWEGLNEYYHFVNNFPEQLIVGDGLFDFTKKQLTFSSICKGYRDSTLLREDAWQFLKMGAHFESVLQILNLLSTKYHDVLELDEEATNLALRNYEWSTLLKCAESFDMCKRYYRRSPGRREVLEFLVLNRSFPKSLCFNLRAINELVYEVSPAKYPSPDDPAFALGKLASEFYYLTFEDIKDNILVFLETTYDRVAESASQIEAKYMSF